MKNELNKTTQDLKEEKISIFRKSQLKLIQQGLTVAAAAVGVGTILRALAAGPQEHGVSPNRAGSFSSNNKNIPAVTASGTNGAQGVSATSDSGYGVSGISSSNVGVYGGGGIDGVSGIGGVGNGVRGSSSGGNGVYGTTDNSNYAGVSGYNSRNGIGVSATSAAGNAISATGTGDDVIKAVYSGSGVKSAVYADGGSATGVTAISTGGSAVYALNKGSGIGVYAKGTPAGHFEGDVVVTGNLSKGGGSFKIDHPQDPAHKYLSHSFVESPDMKNIYDGVVTLDANGEVEVNLPSWFDTLNRDFRYQLTTIGAPGPNLYIAQEIMDNRFTIAGGQAGMKVSWMVTGIRQDAWANAHRIPVEQDKQEQEQGRYLYPELYGKAKEESISYRSAPSRPSTPALPHLTAVS